MQYDLLELFENYSSFLDFTCNYVLTSGILSRVRAIDKNVY